MIVEAYSRLNSAHSNYAHILSSRVYNIHYIPNRFFTQACRKHTSKTRARETFEIRN